MGWGALILILIGFVLNFVAGKLHFDRRNEYGVEEYGSYASAVGTSVLSGGLTIIGRICIFLGLIMGVLSLFTGKSNAPASQSAQVSTKQSKATSTPRKGSSRNEIALDKQPISYAVRPYEAVSTSANSAGKSRISVTQNEMLENSDSVTKTIPSLIKEGRQCLKDGNSSCAYANAQIVLQRVPNHTAALDLKVKAEKSKTAVQ